MLQYHKKITLQCHFNKLKLTADKNIMTFCKRQTQCKYTNKIENF